MEMALANTVTSGTNTIGNKMTFSRKYRRLDKPPYTYVALTALAIQSSQQKRLRLSEILKRICEMFPFFKNSYAGWKDSIRHNLSNNQCFILDLKDPNRTNSKGNYWRVDVYQIPDDKLRRQNTSVSRNVQSGFTYAADLNEVFHLQSGKIRRRINESVLTVQTGITPILLQPAGDGFLHKPVPFYDEQNAPSILEILGNLRGDDMTSDINLLSGRKRKALADGGFDVINRICKASDSPYATHSMMSSFPNRPPLYFPAAPLPTSQTLTTYFPVTVEHPSTSSDDNISEHSSSIARKSPLSHDIISNHHQPDLLMFVKPPYSIAGLSIVAYMALGGKSVTGWQLGEKLRALFPYWDNGNRICSLLLSITASLTNLNHIFIQDPAKPAHWTVNLYSIHRSINILVKNPDEDNYLLADSFVDSLYPIIKKYGNSLHEFTIQRIQHSLLVDKNNIEESHDDGIPDVEIEDVTTLVQTARSQKTLSDEGYISPITKTDNEMTLSPMANFPHMFQKNALMMKNMTNPFVYSGSLYNPLQVPNFYSILPFLSQASMQSGFYLPQMNIGRPLVVESNQTDDRKYTRHAKPPYSYSSIIMLALLTEETRALPLREIVRRIAILFPFFRGSYLGWKDSIRHNLSSCRSFVKCSSSTVCDGDKARIGSCGTFVPDGMETERLLRQNTYVARSALDAGVRLVKDLRYRIEFRYGFLTEAATVHLSKVNYKTGIENLLLEQVQQNELSPPSHTTQAKISLSEIFKKLEKSV